MRLVTAAGPADEPVAPSLAAIVAERDELKEQLRQLQEEQDATVSAVPGEIAGNRVTTLERKILALLMTRSLVTRPAILRATARDAAEDGRGERISDVLIFHLRRKLRSVGVVIRTHRGEGYSLSPADRSALKRLFGMADLSGGAADRSPGGLIR